MYKVLDRYTYLQYLKQNQRLLLILQLLQYTYILLCSKERGGKYFDRSTEVDKNTDSKQVINFHSSSVIKPDNKKGSQNINPEIKFSN